MRHTGTRDSANEPIEVVHSNPSGALGHVLGVRDDVVGPHHHISSPNACHKPAHKYQHLSIG